MASKLNRLTLMDFEALSKYIYHPAKHYKKYDSKLISAHYNSTSQDMLKEEAKMASSSPNLNETVMFKQETINNNTKRKRGCCSNFKDILTNRKNPLCLPFYIILVLVLVLTAIIAVVVPIVIIKTQTSNPSTFIVITNTTTSMPVRPLSALFSTVLTLSNQSVATKRQSIGSIDPDLESLFSNITRAVRQTFICFFTLTPFFRAIVANYIELELVILD